MPFLKFWRGECSHSPRPVTPLSSPDAVDRMLPSSPPPVRQLGRSTTLRRVENTRICHFLLIFRLRGYRASWLQLWQNELDLTNCFWILSEGLQTARLAEVFSDTKLEYLFREQVQINDMFNTKWNREFIFDIYFVTLNDLDNASSKYFFFDPVWLRVNLWFLIFAPRNVSLLIACQS